MIKGTRTTRRCTDQRNVAELLGNTVYPASYKNAVPVTFNGLIQYQFYVLPLFYDPSESFRR